MGLRTFLATGMFLRVMERLLSLNIRVSGEEKLVDRPTLYVVNHFTRFETAIVPYVIHRIARKQVRSLADHGLFKGVLGKYLRSCGTMSTKAPLRNRAIIGDLITGRHGWVIYPEGLMVKNKKIVKGGKLMLHTPKRQGPPHTGAAVLALKAEQVKHMYTNACARGDMAQANEHALRYGIDHPSQVCREGIVLTPVNITYYPLRPDKNLLHRLASLMGADLSEKMDEELRVEGELLLGDTDMSVNFGDPIEVTEYMDKPTDLARRMVGLVSTRLESRLFMGRQATRLTHRAMRSIYSQVEVNLDHLFCYALRALRHDSISIKQLHKAVYLTAVELRGIEGVRLHPHLNQDLTPLVTSQPFPPIDSVVELAEECGVLRQEGGCYHIDRSVMEAEHPFHFHVVRVRNMPEVIANELEPVGPAVKLVRKYVNLAKRLLDQRVSQTAQAVDTRRYEAGYHTHAGDGAKRSIEIGQPFLLEHPNAETGVVLIHGYLAAPEEIRPLAEYLHGRGFSVYGVCLEGHGIAPGALASVDWRQWVNSACRGYAVMRPRCKRLVVGGFSMGGVLSLYVAANKHRRVDGVFTVNSPMRLKDWRSKLIPAVTMWNRAVRAVRLKTGLYEKICNRDTENPGINYEQNPLHGTRQLQLMISACRRRIHQVMAPTLIIQGDGDPIVDPESGQIIYESLGSKHKTLVPVSYDRHVIVRGSGSEPVLEKICEFVGSVNEIGSEAGLTPSCGSG